VSGPPVGEGSTRVANNARTVVKLATAINDRDERAFSRLVSHELELVNLPCANGRIYQGATGVKALFSGIGARRGLSVAIRELHDLDERVVVFGKASSQGTPEWAGGIGDLVAVVHFASQLVSRIHVCRDREDAWSAAGLGRLGG